MRGAKITFKVAKIQAPRDPEPMDYKRLFGIFITDWVD